MLSTGSGVRKNHSSMNKPYRPSLGVITSGCWTSASIRDDGSSQARIFRRPLSSPQPDPSDLFRSLQTQNSDFTVWVDPLCINQGDLEENASQVCRIGLVFSSAKPVVVWFGESDETRRAAFSVMKSKGRDPAGLKNVFHAARTTPIPAGVGDPGNHGRKKAGESLDLLALCGVGSGELSPSLPTSSILMSWDVTCPAFDSHSVARQRAAVAAVRALMLRLSDDVSEGEWMDRLGTTLLFGLDIDDPPLDERATLKYRSEFRGCFEWLHSRLSQGGLGKFVQNEHHRTIGLRMDD
ncbi:hypothetical protein DL769_000831 [Monosporascus sp. CRB-8-3]|nr:hypothetical protein DL769_000831 [Monosporascus sp. CRB-8-3]